jgi:hypothetical protein
MVVVTAWPNGRGERHHTTCCLGPPEAHAARVATQPGIARAVRCLSLYDQLDLTLELLHQRDWPDFDSPEDLPPNVIPFRRRRN